MIKNSVTDTLFLPLSSGAIGEIPAGKRIAALNVYPNDMLKTLQMNNNLCVYEHFRPYADALSGAGFFCTQNIDDLPDALDMAFFQAPQNVQETEFLISKILKKMNSDGVLVVAAGNKAGGSRLPKILNNFDLQNVQDLSKNKARVVWGVFSGELNDFCEKAASQGDIQEVLDGSFISQPGIYGWNKEDKGSKLLIESINEDFYGKIADFGCGYGYLSANLIKKYPKIKKITGFDADYRAIQACNINLNRLKTEIAYDCIWIDITKPFQGAEEYDLIIMNPPFHEGKTTDNSIGQKFIQNAHNALRSKGRLWMVANAHLPYEGVLKNLFGDVQKISENQGFKVYRCTK